MKFSPTDCFTIFGMRGSGKSYLAAQIAQKFPRQIILDPMSEYSGDAYADDIPSLIRLFQQVLEKKMQSFKIVFRPSPHVRAADELIDNIFRLVFELGNCTLILEEAQLFSTPHKLPHYLKNILMIGRHRKINVIAITQRPAQLNKAILAQSAHIFCGQLHERNDIDCVSDFLHVEKRILQKLGRRKFVYFSPFEDEIRYFSTEK